MLLENVDKYARDMIDMSRERRLRDGQDLGSLKDSTEAQLHKGEAQRDIGCMAIHTYIRYMIGHWEQTVEEKWLERRSRIGQEGDRYITTTRSRWTDSQV